MATNMTTLIINELQTCILCLLCTQENKNRLNTVNVKVFSI